MNEVVLLRRRGLGLESLTNIKNSINEIRPNTARINRVELGTRIGYDIVFNWGNTDRSLIYKWRNIMNTPEAIAKTSNKGRFRKELYDNGLTMTTYLGTVPSFSNGDKYVVRPLNHFGGIKLRLVSNESEYYNAVRDFGGSVYSSKYIKKTNEYRVFVANGRVVYVVEKIVDNTDAVAWNVHQGGRFEAVSWGNWNLKVVDYAVKAFNLTSLDFGAIDVIIDSDGNPYVLEINSAPAMTSPYWVSCVSKVFLYMLDKGNERLVVAPNSDNWKYYIHPAISDKAKSIRRVERSSRVEVQRVISWSLDSSDYSETAIETIIEALRSGNTSGSFSITDTEDTMTFEEYVDA